MPVYTQTLLGWTAWQSGLSSLPSSITTLASILDRRSDVHEAELARHLSPVDSGTVAGLERLIDGFPDRGLDPEAAALAARHALDRMLGAQAMMEAFYDAFAFIAVLFMVLFPLAILMPKDMPGKTDPVD